MPDEDGPREDPRAARERLLAILEEAQRLGFIGPGPLGPQLDHAFGFVGLLRTAPRPLPDATTGGALPPAPMSTRIADLGSGGGLPGLVVAAAVAGAFVSLVESQARRAAFLGDALVALGLGARAEVLHERAEVVGRGPGRRASYDAVTARAFGPPAVTAECAAPLLRPGGTLIVSEPPSGSGTSGSAGPAGSAGRWPPAGLAVLGLGEAVRRGDGSGYGFEVVRQVAPCPERYPRRVGVPAKRPLF